MSIYKVLKLAQNFYEKIEEYDKMRTNQQVFLYSINNKMARIIEELNQDYNVLKHKKFDKDQLKLMRKISIYCKAIYENMKNTNSDKGFKQLVEFVMSKPNRAAINELEFLIKYKTEGMANPIKVLGDLKNLAYEIDDYMIYNKIGPASVTELKEVSMSEPETSIESDDGTNIIKK